MTKSLAIILFLFSFYSFSVNAQEDTLVNNGVHKIGDFAQGGIIFWLDESGRHGLVCSKSDQDPAPYCPKGIGFEDNTMAIGDGPYSGEGNTLIILSTYGYGSNNGRLLPYAASVCYRFVNTEGGSTYGDWYLPSKEELNIMCLNKELINKVAISYGGEPFGTLNGGKSKLMFYWSSTDTDHFNKPSTNMIVKGGYGAWFRDFGKSQSYQITGVKDMILSVRAIRAF
tara:strand:+ start:72 stop:752 length:681 start_codon:yes stop_codon:yes gene_type:complete